MFGTGEIRNETCEKQPKKKCHDGKSNSCIHCSREIRNLMQQMEKNQ